MNDFLASFPGATLDDKIDVTELNEIILNRITKSWSKQDHAQGFCYKSISFKKAVNMFEGIEISESIYGGVIQPSYKKPIWTDTNPDGNRRQNRGEDASSKTHPTRGESSGKRQKWYIDHRKIESKTCLIHGTEHSYDKWKFLGDFGVKYTKSKPTKDHRINPIPRENINRHLLNNYIINNVVDGIILNETQK